MRCSSRLSLVNKLVDGIVYRPYYCSYTVTNGREAYSQQILFTPAGSAGTEGDLLYADPEAAVNIIENVGPFDQLSKLCTPAHLLGTGTYGSVTL